MFITTHSMSLYNSLIIHGSIHQIVLGYIWFICLLNISIKRSMTTAQKIVNNLMNENIFPLQVSSLRQVVWKPIYVKTHISLTKSLNISVSIWLRTLGYMLNEYEICLNTTNYLTVNMQDFRYWLCTFISDCFSQLVSPLSQWESSWLTMAKGMFSHG